MSSVIPMANAAVSIKPMMTQFEPNVSIATSSWIPSIGSNQTSGRQVGGRINTGILPWMAEILAARPATLTDAHCLLGEAVSLRALVPLQRVDGGQGSKSPQEHRRAEDQFAGNR
jgi:hypothetical protein